MSLVFILGLLCYRVVVTLILIRLLWLSLLSVLCGMALKMCLLRFGARILCLLLIGWSMLVLVLRRLVLILGWAFFVSMLLGFRRITDLLRRLVCDLLTLLVVILVRWARRLCRLIRLSLIRLGGLWRMI